MHRITCPACNSVYGVKQNRGSKECTCGYVIYYNYGTDAVDLPHVNGEESTIYKYKIRMMNNQVHRVNSNKSTLKDFAENVFKVKVICAEETAINVENIEAIWSVGLVK